MKKLALLLTLCLVVTMLPGIGHTEDGVALDVGMTQADGSFPAGTLELELDEAGDIGDLLSGGDLNVELDVPDDAVRIADGIGDIQLPGEDEGEPSTENGPEGSASAPADSGPAEGAKPHADPGAPKLDADEMTLGIDDYRYLISSNKSGDGVTYFSSDSSIAKVYKSGRVTGVSEGFAIVTAANDNGDCSECFVYVKKAPVEVSFNASSLTLGVGESYKQLKVKLGDPAEEYGGSYTLESENTRIVKVKSNNVLKGVRKGTTRVKVLTYNGIKAALKVTVKAAPDSVTLSADKQTLGVGESGKVSYKLSKGSAGAVTFASDKPKIVSVDKDTGEMKALAVGKATITATAFNKIKGSVTIEVLAAPKALSFEGEGLRLGVGMQLKATASAGEGAGGTITYSVRDAKVAAYANGVLKGLKAGTTVLTARAYNGVTAECPVTVVPAPSAVRLPWSTLNIGVKQSVRLEPDVGDSASTFTYSTSNKKVVKVAKDGTVTGVKKGSATVTVKTYNGKKCKLKVKVLKNPASVELTPDSLELSVGETAALSWSFPKGTAAAVSFESSDPAVARVDPQTGVVTGVSRGEATVTVTTANGKTDQTAVKVFNAPKWVRFTEELLEIGVSQSHRLTVEMDPGAASTLRFESSDEGVATVSDSGTVTGVGKGSATISVFTHVEGVSATVSVTVLPAPKSVKFSPKKMKLNIGETALLVPVITKGSATGFTYVSSDPEVAAVSEDGSLSAISRGKATVTVTTSNALSADLAVTVEDPSYPVSAKLTNAPSTMEAGETLQLEWEVTPAGAILELAWETSNEEIAYVDAAGVLHAVGMGFATLTATSGRNPDIVLSFRVSVESDELTLTIPARITGTGDIGKNLARIDAIRQSAIAQIEMLKSDGKITSSDASKRKRIINNAFADNAFPWMTLKKQKYWKAKYDEGGAKDFKPDRVYYGVPYTQTKRAYNVERLLSSKRYYDSGKGYYILDQSKVDDRKYCGSDCSSFVDAAIWGTGSDHSDDRTNDIMKSSAYKTIKNYGDLRTGDLICKGHAHVVMFLYFVNAEKTKMMIIENGGIEAGTNTVHCMIMNVKWYTSRSYKVRRLKSLG